jgi:Sulfatase/C-terminal region of aryl-sulfatase
MMNPETNYGLEEAGMAQLDDSVGALMKALDDMGEANNTIVVFSTDNGAETFTWPDGGITPFRASKGTIHEGGFRVPAIIRWPGHVKPGTVENGLFSGLDWYPSFVAAAGNPNITEQLLQGVRLGDQTYKNHLDGYNQMALLEGKGPSARHELFYFGGAELGAVRVDNFKYQFYTQPEGWPGPKVAIDMPLIYNNRQDPFEQTPILNFAEGAPAWFNEFFGREAWRFVLVQDVRIFKGFSARPYVFCETDCLAAVDDGRSQKKRTLRYAFEYRSRQMLHRRLVSLSRHGETATGVECRIFDACARSARAAMSAVVALPRPAWFVRAGSGHAAGCGELVEPLT